MTEKVNVNGQERHELFRSLVSVPDERGRTGDVEWNFEKFLLAADGAVLSGRFHCGVEPGDERLVAAVERALGVSTPGLIRPTSARRSARRRGHGAGRA